MSKQQAALALNHGARALICLTLLFAPWVFGSVRLWSLRTIEILVAITVVLLAISLRLGTTGPTDPAAWRWTWGVPLLALALYIGVQSLNASHYYQYASDVSLVPQPHLAWLPHSVDGVVTWQTWIKYLAFAGLFWSVRIGFSDPALRQTLLTVLIVSGFIMALVAILQKLSGTSKVFWVHTPVPGGAVFGPFYNRNNYAAYLNLLVPITLTMGRRIQWTAVAVGRKSHPGYLYYFIAAVMISSVFLSESRAGMIVCTGLVVAVILAEIVRHRKSQERRQRVRPWSLVWPGLIAAGLLIYLGLRPIQNRLATLRDFVGQTGGKLEVDRRTFTMFQDHWVYGIGAGTFLRLYPEYQPRPIRGFYRNAHCDWLQYLAELGVVGSALLVLFGIAVAWPRSLAARSSARPQKGFLLLNSSRFHIPLGLCLALIGVGLHAVVDFPMHIPGVATLAIACFALLCGTVETVQR